MTVCGNAQQDCPKLDNDPTYGKTKVVHVGFDDPPALVDGLGDQEERLNVYRRVRDEIEVWIQSLPISLGEG